MTAQSTPKTGDFDEAQLESLIRRWQEQGDLEARGELIDLMYGWLKRQSSILLNKRYAASPEGNNRPLITTTELTHNLVVKLMEMQARLKWEGRGRFLSFVLTVMRNYLTDLAKSAYHRTKVPLEDQVVEAAGETMAMLEFGSGKMKAILPASDIDRMHAITEIFKRYEDLDPLRGQIIQLHVFCGAGPDEIARYFDGETALTTADVQGHLRIAKVYLRREMAKAGLNAA